MRSGMAERSNGVGPMRVFAKVLVALVWLCAYAAVGGSPAHAAEAVGPCARAVALVESAKLEDATAVATAVGGQCPTTVERLVTAARAAAQRLADAAAADPEDAEKKRLATLSLSINDANEDATAVLESLKVQPVPTACDEADQALEDGEFARAKILYDALKDDETADCRTEGLQQLAQAQESGLPTRIRHFVLEDGLMTWTVALVAFAIGVVGAGFWRFFASMLDSSIFTGLVAIGLVGWQWGDRSQSLSDSEQALLVGQYVVLLALAAFAGLWLSNAVRTRAPLRITVGGDEDNQVAPAVIADLHALGEAKAAGVYAPAATDVSGSGVSGALDQVGHPIVKAVLAVWKAIQLGAADRVEVTLVTKEKTPSSASVMLYRGRHLVETRSVDGSEFCVDPSKPTDAEVAATSTHVATGLAAAILLWRVMGNDATGEGADQAKQRLYGARDPRGVALAAVAARRLSRGEESAAALLYARAVDLDSKNRVARFGRVSAALRTYPSGRTAQKLIKELDELRGLEEEVSPLKWRMTFNLAAAIANSALAGQEPNANLIRRPHVVAAFAEAKTLLDEVFLEDLSTAGAVLASDRALWDKLKELADVTRYGLEPDDPSVPVSQRPSEKLMASPLRASSAVQHAVACGLALAYARTRPSKRDRRRRLGRGLHRPPAPGGSESRASRGPARRPLLRIRLGNGAVCGPEEGVGRCHGHAVHQGQLVR